MEAKFSPRVKDVITYSREEALRLGHDYIGIEHLMLGMIRDGDGVGMKLLKSLGVDASELRKVIEHNLTPGLRKSNNLANIPLVKQAEKTLKLTYLEAKTFKSIQIGTEHLLLCILKETDNLVSKSLLKYGVDYDAARAELMTFIDNPQKIESATSSNDDDDEETSFGGGNPTGGAQKKQGESKSKTPVLDNFGRDLTKAAEEGKLDPIVGREKKRDRACFSDPIAS